ncbi:3-phosphoserine/phosphohydroxythreonine transaminase [Thiotrichales bacterium 19S9-12]|nr:3-phosphoserine/phosphohydroxythreonine transaminase [Thiotrichales bacterium 19S9-11]MCF6811203.1 3-phosphoserine/phosphohydroxythreonine transaminase [Thiotrichales bacterium 19S9-12]
MSCSFNYCAGPAVLAEPVKAKLLAAIENFDNTGVSLLSFSHRDDRFREIILRMRALLREFLNIPENYQVLFFHGGATTQFYSIAENLKSQGKAIYLDCGFWSKMAIKEASKVLDVDVLTPSFDELFLRQCFEISKSYDYLHYVDNETIDGREFQYIPDTKDVPLVCDMSSNLLSRDFDVKKFSLIYAGAQKNLGIPGLAIVIVRDDMIKKLDHISTVQSYYEASQKDSLMNTPSVMALYTTYLVFEWLKAQGGVSEIEKINQQKAEMFYQYLDNSEIFKPLVAQPVRSKMNAVFTRHDANHDKINLLVKQAEADGFYGIGGHRSLGGFRVSLYNAVSLEAVDALINYLKDYELNEK